MPALPPTSSVPVHWVAKKLFHFSVHPQVHQFAISVVEHAVRHLGYASQRDIHVLQQLYRSESLREWRDRGVRQAPEWSVGMQLTRLAIRLRPELSGLPDNRGSPSLAG